MLAAVAANFRAQALAQSGPSSFATTLTCVTHPAWDVWTQGGCHPPSPMSPIPSGMCRCRGVFAHEVASHSRMLAAVAANFRAQALAQLGPS